MQQFLWHQAKLGLDNNPMLLNGGGMTSAGSGVDSSLLFVPPYLIYGHSLYLAYAYM